MKEPRHILIVEDEEGAGRTLALILGREGYNTEIAVCAEEAIEKACERFFHIALIDIGLPDMEGIELVPLLKAKHPDMMFIIVTAYASMTTAIRAMKEQVLADITKPLNMDELVKLPAHRAEHLLNCLQTFTISVFA